MANPIIYKSTDSSAPVLTGTAGDLITLLDAILVGTAGIAYGSTASAGWTKAYSGTNKAAYRNNSVTGSGCYARIDDASPGAGGAREAFMRTYKTMSDVDTGTYPCPSVAQNANGQIIRKSSTADSTARPWILVADDRTFYLVIGASVTSFTSTESANSTVCGAGDYITANAGDTYNYFCAGRNVVNASSSPQQGILMALSSNYVAGAYSFYLIASNSGTPTAYTGNFAVPGLANACIGRTTNTMALPSPISGQSFFSDAIIGGSSTIFGVARGIACPLHDITSLATGATVSGATGRPVGSVLVLFRGHLTSDAGGLYIESATAWG